jgi:hypothetical protein
MQDDMMGLIIQCQGVGRTVPVLRDWPKVIPDEQGPSYAQGYGPALRSSLPSNFGKLSFDAA